MKKKNAVKKTGDTSCFSLSDWVTFLSNEKHGMMNNVVNFAVLLVGVIALGLATSGYTVLAIASVMVALGCVGWAYFKVLGPLHQRGNLADGILKRIISGEFRDADTIRDEWVLGLSVIRRGWLRQAKGRLAAFKRAWRYQAKPRLLAFAQTCQRRWEAGLAALHRA